MRVLELCRAEPNVKERRLKGASSLPAGLGAARCWPVHRVVVVALTSILAIVGAAFLASALTKSPVTVKSLAPATTSPKVSFDDAGDAPLPAASAGEAPLGESPRQGEGTDGPFESDAEVAESSGASVGETASGPASSLMLDDLLLLSNQTRAAYQMGPLESDPLLAAEAAIWARQMAETARYEHSDVARLSSIMSSGGFGAIGENIHAPERQCIAAPSCSHVMAQPTSGTLHVDWMRSPSHRINLLDGRWDRAGFGAFCAADGRVWAVALFASSTPTLNEPIAPPTAVPELALDDAGFTCPGVQRPSNPSWRHPVGNL